MWQIKPITGIQSIWDALINYLIHNRVKQLSPNKFDGRFSGNDSNLVLLYAPLFGQEMAQIDVVCPRCSKTEGVIRNGHSTSGAQLYRCKLCLKTFQLNFHYNAVLRHLKNWDRNK